MQTIGVSFLWLYLTKTFHLISTQRLLFKQQNFKQELLIHKIQSIVCDSWKQ